MTLDQLPKGYTEIADEKSYNAALAAYEKENPLFGGTNPLLDARKATFLNLFESKIFGLTHEQAELVWKVIGLGEYDVPEITGNH